MNKAYNFYLILVLALLTSCTDYSSDSNTEKFLLVQTTGPQLFENLPVNALSPYFSIPLKKSQFNTKKSLLEQGKKHLSLHYMIDGQAADQPISIIYRYFSKRLYAIPSGVLGKNEQFEIRYNKKGSWQKQYYTTPASLLTDAPSTRPIEWYPIGPQIPENNLLFYVVFNNKVEIHTKTMQYVDIASRENGIVDLAWTNYLMPKLPEFRYVFPLMIHPGRIKTGVITGLLYGPVLEEGNRYTITLRKEGFQDQYYRFFHNDFSRQYIVGPRDTTLPRFLPDQSRPPEAATTEPVLLVFSEAMDYSSIKNSIAIYPGDQLQNSDQTAIPYTVTHDQNDSRWLLTPTLLWHDTPYTVEITKHVKDLAHNSLSVPFETETIEERESGTSVFWEFTPISN